MTNVIPKYFSFSYFFEPYWNNSVAIIIDISQKIQKSCNNISETNFNFKILTVIMTSSDTYK